MQLNKLPVFFAALLAALISFAIYILWPSYMYAPDSLQAAMSIQYDATGIFSYHPAGGVIFEPGLADEINEGHSQNINMRYYLDYATSVLAYRLWNALGYDGLVVTPVLALRAFAGALGVFFFVLTIFELTGQRLIAFLAGLGLGICASYWTFATDMYQTINWAALVSVSFYILVRQSKRDSPGLRLGDKALLALTLSLALLYSILAVFTIGAFGIAVALIHSRGRWLDRLAHLAVFGVIFVALTGVLFVVTYNITQPTSGQVNPLTWSDEDSGTNQEVFQFEPVQDAFRLFIGFTKSHAIFPGVSVRNFQGFRTFWDTSSTIQKGTAIAFYGAIALAAVLPVGVLFWKRRALPVRQRWLLVLLPLWFLVYAGFNWLWLPSDVHYWIVVMMIWWTAVSLCLSVVRIELARYYRPALALAGAYVLFTFGINFISQFLPESRPENNPWLAVSDALRESEPNALFISSGHPLDFHVAYFTHRNVLSTAVVALTTNDAEDVNNEIINTQVAAHRRYDGNIYLYTYKGESIDDLAAIVGLTGDDLEVAWEFPQLTIYRAVFPDDGGQFASG